GILNLIKAIELIFSKNNKLNIFIAGEGELFQETYKFIQTEKNQYNITLHPWITPDHLPNYLNEIKLIVLPSKKEGLPNIMLEAMACGTPVLATPVGAIPGVIQDGVTGFIMENNTPECIARNVIRALNHPDLEGIAERGRRYVEEEFTFEKAVERWRRVLNAI
ncbi:MAG: glycosyltransferase family 4 protein, partial [Methanolinea sp.]|nr:glycosyltransferase family 4 protein [Methanolinea sp.]